MRTKVACAVLLMLLAVRSGLASKAEDVERIVKTGATLAPEIAAQFPLAEQKVTSDTGVNVLIDLSHQANFFLMWGLPGALRRNGLRACGSQATLDTVLKPAAQCRVRIPFEGKRKPFAWLPAPRFNVVLAMQSSPRSQAYLPEEKEALKQFVRNGGGLVMVGGRVMKADDLKAWPLNGLAKEFEAEFLSETDEIDGIQVCALKLGSAWEAQTKGAKGKPLIARREYGKGRIVLISSSAMIDLKDKKATQEVNKAREKTTVDAIKWASAGSAPVGGSLRLPCEQGGGGPIYPDLEKRVGNVIVYYAKNQKKELLDAVDKDMPLAKQKVETWLPSAPPDEPLYLIVSAGGGGGWAVNAYTPKETGVISLTAEGLLSVFGHELAHTMGGPANAKGQLAGSWPQGNQGESHAGWFQGKVIALFNEEARGRSNRKCSDVLEWDKPGNRLDLAMPAGEMKEKWGKGKEWHKIWYVWQKLDDRYGPTWYPRWRWVQYTRWQDTPDRRLTWDETVEDMSIAVGEDLFPFFRKLGTTLKKDRFEHAVFQDQTIELPVAPLEPTPGGPVCLDPIGDYTKPLKPKRS